jgi:hypothetical protein
MTNHSKDHHVLAAAARASAKTIVTYNSKDLPRCSLMPYSITAQGPSAFLKDLYVAATTLVAQRPRERIFSFSRTNNRVPLYACPHCSSSPCTPRLISVLFAFLECR